MNTLYITSNFETIQPQLVEALNQQKGINAYLFCYDIRKKKEKAMPEYGYYYSLKNRIHGPFPYIYRLYKISQEVIRYNRIKNIRIIHANMGFREGIICYFVWKKERIPYIISIRDTDLNAGMLWKIGYIRKLFYKVLRYSKYVVFLSDSYQDLLLERLPDELREEVQNKSRIIPNGIHSFYIQNRSIKKKKSKKDICNLLFVGKVSKRKNLELVVKAIEILQKEGYSFYLDVVGEIVDEEYKNLMDSKNFITYHEKCPKEKLIDFYGKSDIFVLPSHTETFGLVYVEAMSQGLPVLYTRGQGFDSEGRDSIIGYAVSDMDAQELADKIILVREHYYELSFNCTRMSMCFDWENISGEIARLYYQSINRQH